MAANDLPENPLDSKQTLEFVRAALHPDERQFFKQYLGQESPDIMDYLLPQGRFERARHIREGLVNRVLNNLIPSDTNPVATLGEAQSISPGFPVPPGHPMVPGTPPEQFGPPNQKPAFIGSPNDTEGLAAYNNMTESYLAPRPGTAPMVPDPNAILPISHQRLLVAKTHQAGLRPYNPSTMLRVDALEKHDAIATGQQPEEYPGQLQELKNYLGLTPRLPGANTAQGRSAEAKATLDELKAKKYAGLTDQQIATMKAREAADNAKAHETYQLFDKRRDLIDSQIARNTAQGKAAGDLLNLNKEKTDLQQAKGLFAYQRYLTAKENLDQEGMDHWSNEVLKLMGAQFGLQREEPNPIAGFFGSQGTLHVTPNPNLPVPQGQPPTGNPMQFQPGSIIPQEQNGLQAPEPITNVQPNVENPVKAPPPPTWAQGMKDGEIRKDPSGRKMQRKGNTLVEVK